MQAHTTPNTCDPVTSRTMQYTTICHAAHHSSTGSFTRRSWRKA